MEVTTTDLAKFGWSEKKMAAQLLTAMVERGLPPGFDDDGVHVMMNVNSGTVFLTNSEYQAAMMNGNRLETWHNCPQCGREGFAEDMHHEGNAGCERFLQEIGVALPDANVRDESLTAWERNR